MYAQADLGLQFSLSHIQKGTFSYMYFQIRKLQMMYITIVKMAKNLPRVSLPLKQGPVVQSILSLTSLLVVKMLSVLVSTIPNSQVFLLKKCE